MHVVVLFVSLSFWYFSDFFVVDNIDFKLFVFLALLGKSSRNLIGTLVFSGYLAARHVCDRFFKSSAVLSQSLLCLFFHFLFVCNCYFILAVHLLIDHLTVDWGQFGRRTVT